MPATQKVCEAIDNGFDASLEELVTLSRIPGVSATGFDPAELERSADAVADVMRDAGLDGVEVLRLPGAHPYVVAEKRASNPGAATALIYAHHDVQPPGRLDRWETPAFEPTLRDDGRLYGRGVVDDKAGFCLHAAALRAWIEAEGGPPLHVKLIVEGEEEIGSGHLAEFLRVHRERLDADVLVLSDTQNLETGIPSLTTSLRGILQVDVSLRVLDHNVHSGMWGGPVPDAATALARLLGRLVDDAGVPAVPGLDDDVPELDAEERARIAALPFDADAFREAAGVVPGVPLSGYADCSVYERLWHRPAIAVTALEAMPFATAANQLVDEARARVGVRLAPGQDPERVAACVIRFLTESPPMGARVEASVVAQVPGWRTAPEGPAFEAARRALSAGFGREAVTIGCGGTIPFVGPFGEVMGGVPQLLLGLEDPPCNAHGENESLDLEDFRKATHAAAHLLSELGVALR
ncbi:MAG: M20/M25/M40 family metallo-hydrolase [Myxococcota bacterium]|nr:M20/M25/M40 family metallo-hydrolase [Myxococcota bacterium]